MTTAHSTQKHPAATAMPTDAVAADPTTVRPADRAATPEARTAAPQSLDDDEDAAVERIVAAGPRGAFAVAGLATALVVAIYLAFFVFAYLPRGAVQ